MPEEKGKAYLYIGVVGATILGAALLSWWGLHWAIDVSDITAWWIPLMAFSLLIACLALAGFTFPERWLSVGSVGLAFGPGLFFIRSPTHLGLLITGALFVMWGLWKIRGDRDLSMRIRLGKSVRAGFPVLIFGFALALSTHYYFQIREHHWETLLPRFELGRASNVLVIQALSFLNPEFKQAAKDNMTVDDFLLALNHPSVSQENSASDFQTELLEQFHLDANNPSVQALLDQAAPELVSQPAVLPDRVGMLAGDLLQASMLEAGREKLSQLVGRKVVGTEKISMALSDLIDRKLRTYFAPSGNTASSGVLAFVLAVLLFFTLLPLGSLLTFLWTPLTFSFFNLAVRTRGIALRTVMVEKEIITLGLTDTTPETGEQTSHLPTI